MGQPCGENVAWMLEHGVDAGYTEGVNNNSMRIDSMATGQDIKDATLTYNAFIKAATWGTGFVIVIVAVVVGLISS